MKKIISYKTSDSSRKITTYKIIDNKLSFFLDFGSYDIKESEISNISFIFISHEHGDHFIGLLKEEYIDIILEKHIKIYASNPTKELISAIFENDLKSSEDTYLIEKTRKVINSITGLLFYQKEYIDNNTYIKLMPSGHTYGSSMIYYSSPTLNILYTGDFDFDSKDQDRKFIINLDKDELVNYLIIDGTYLNENGYKDEDLTDIKDKIINKNFNNFYIKAEKAPFVAKKLLKFNSINEDYVIIYKDNIKWYLSILTKFGYNPFIPYKLILISEYFPIDEKLRKIYLTSIKNPKEKCTPINRFIGLHISLEEFRYNFLNQFNNKDFKVYVGHYDLDKVDEYNNTFNAINSEDEVDISLLYEGSVELI